MKLYQTFFSQLNNGQKTAKACVRISYSLFSVKILQILQQNGYISHWYLEDSLVVNKRVSVVAHYKKESFKTSFSNAVSFKIIAVSTKKSPSFVRADNLWRLNNGLSIYILSTNRGFITDRQARQWNVGGKVLCVVES